MHRIGQLVTGIKDAFDFNHSNLSGALDVIVIQHEDLSLHSSSFHVRFGKWKVFRSKEKQVRLHVNGVPVNVRMKLGSAGEAFFVEETEERIADDLVTSPIIEPMETPQGSPTNAQSQGRRQMSLDMDVLDEPGKKEIQAKKGFFGRIVGYFKKDSGKISAQTGDPLVQLSICREQIEQGQNSEEAFLKGMVTWEQFKSDPWEVLSHQNLVVRFDGKLLDWNTAAPLVFAQLVYSQTLEIPPEEPDSDTFASPKHQSPVPEEEEVKSILLPPSPPTAYRKSLNLSSAMLSKLHLKPGVNDIIYTVSSRIQGDQSLHGKIYLWDSWSKIVVSDIDGTITRSDMLGHLFTMVGKDWSHKGICKLYTNIMKNGYKLLYLTARAIGQIGTTKGYLESLNQDNELLPDGPVFTSPDRLFESFVREVITKEPHKFKSQVLKSLAELFPPDRNPLYAGFGNRETDEIAYHSAGITPDRTFTINPSGDIVNGNSFKTTYPQLTELVEHVFSPLQSNFHTEESQLEDSDFSMMKFWKIPTQHLLPEDLVEEL